MGKTDQSTAGEYSCTVEAFTEAIAGQDTCYGIDMPCIAHVGMWTGKAKADFCPSDKEVR